MQDECLHLQQDGCPHLGHTLPVISATNDSYIESSFRTKVPHKWVYCPIELDPKVTAKAVTCDLKVSKFTSPNCDEHLPGLFSAPLIIRNASYDIQQEITHVPSVRRCKEIIEKETGNPKFATMGATNLQNIESQVETETGMSCVLYQEYCEDQGPLVINEDGDNERTNEEPMVEVQEKGMSPPPPIILKRIKSENQDDPVFEIIKVQSLRTEGKDYDKTNSFENPDIIPEVSASLASAENLKKKVDFDVGAHFFDFANCSPDSTSLISAENLEKKVDLDVGAHFSEFANGSPESTSLISAENLEKKVDLDVGAHSSELANWSAEPKQRKDNQSENKMVQIHSELLNSMNIKRELGEDSPVQFILEPVEKISASSIIKPDPDPQLQVCSCTNGTNVPDLDRILKIQNIIHPVSEDTPPRIINRNSQTKDPYEITRLYSIEMSSFTSVQPELKEQDIVGAQNQVFRNCLFQNISPELLPLSLRFMRQAAHIPVLMCPLLAALLSMQGAQEFLAILLELNEKIFGQKVGLCEHFGYDEVRSVSDLLILLRNHVVPIHPSHIGVLNLEKIQFDTFIKNKVSKRFSKKWELALASVRKLPSENGILLFCLICSNTVDENHFIHAHAFCMMPWEIRQIPHNTGTILVCYTCAYCTGSILHMFLHLLKCKSSGFGCSQNCVCSRPGNFDQTMRHCSKHLGQNTLEHQLHLLVKKVQQNSPQEMEISSEIWQYLCRFFQNNMKTLENNLLKLFGQSEFADILSINSPYKSFFEVLVKNEKLPVTRRDHLYYLCNKIYSSPCIFCAPVVECSQAPALVESVQPRHRKKIKLAEPPYRAILMGSVYSKIELPGVQLVRLEPVLYSPISDKLGIFDNDVRHPCSALILHDSMIKNPRITHLIELQGFNADKPKMMINEVIRQVLLIKKVVNTVAEETKIIPLIGLILQPPPPNLFDIYSTTLLLTEMMNLENRIGILCHHLCLWAIPLVGPFYPSPKFDRRTMKLVPLTPSITDRLSRDGKTLLEKVISHVLGVSTQIWKLFPG